MPRAGGVLVQPMPTDPPSLDVRQTTTFAAVWPLAPAFNQIIQFDPDKPNNAPSELIPDLAEKWEQPDPTTIVFTVRKGVKFHDGGDFTAEDVKVNVDWLRRPPQGKVHPRQNALATVENVEVVDPTTVRMTLSRPTPSLLSNLASHYFAIGQGKDIVQNGEISPRLIGTGPFKLKQYQRANMFELEKNPAYHIAGRPYLDGLRFFIIPDLNTRITNLIGGQYQFMWDVQLRISDQERIKAEAGDKFDLPVVPGTNRDQVFMNARRKPYDDVRVRQAISLALDRDAAIKVIREGAGRRGGYMMPTGAWALPEAEIRRYEGYDKPDIQKARQLLAAAGVQTPLEATGTTRTDYKDTAEFLKDQLAKIGINLRLTLADTPTAQPVVQRGDFDITNWGFAINVDDPDTTFSEMSTSKAVRNWSGVFDPQVDALYERQSQTMNFEERKKIVNDLEKQALSVYQIAALYFIDLPYAQAKAMRNFTIHSSIFTNRRLESVWLRQG
jgi:peptide/nickel transport system substrate-binding protein